MVRKRRVALVAPGLNTKGGGVSTLAGFLYQVLLSSNTYSPDLLSLATSIHDESSVRLLSPNSWLSGIQTSQIRWENIPAIHVGANLVELEFQRYRPRQVLTSLLNEYDLVQIVAGSPAWAMVTKHVSRPVLLHVATLASVERIPNLRYMRGSRRLWLRLMTAITGRLDRQALQHVQRVSVINAWMYEYTAKLVGERKVVFAPPGIDTSVFLPAKQFPDDGFILSVGRFADPRKNVRLLFEAYHELKAKMSSAPPLVLAGRSRPNQRDWQVAVDLGITNSVQFHRDLSLSELADLYRQARLFVLASDEEGLGIVLLEAMATGLPVVATRCGGPETVVVNGESGYLTAVGDPIALANKMHTLLNDSDLSQQMGTSARALMVGQYSLEAAGKTVLAVYDSIIDRR